MYETERRTNAQRVLGISEDLMQKHVEGDESAMERGENARQLDVSYRDLADTRAIAPGDRAPDATLTDADGNQLRLFDLKGRPETPLHHSADPPAHSPDPRQSPSRASPTRLRPNRGLVGGLVSATGPPRHHNHAGASTRRGRAMRFRDRDGLAVAGRIRRCAPRRGAPRIDECSR